MQSMVESAINGFNRVLREQREVPGSSKFTLVLFDGRYECPIHSVPIAKIVELDTATFVPRGNLALLDAIGRTIDKLGEKLASTPEAARPSQVIVAILTDSQENASTRYRWECVAKRIHHQTMKYQWRFLFLGSNQGAIATTGRMNIAAADTANFAMTERSYDCSRGTFSRKTSAFRHCG
jgi:hypothetical protein